MKPAAVIAQCYENIHAVLGFYDIPEPPCVDKLTNKVMFGASSGLIEWMDWLTIKQKFERWDFVANHGVTAKSGWRERVARYSMQVILHERSVEVDIDYWNPNFGAAPAFCHLLEVWTPGETNPFRVARGLRKRGIDVPDVKET